MELSKRKFLTGLFSILFQILPLFFPVTIFSPRDLKFKWKWRLIYKKKSCQRHGMRLSSSNSDRFLFQMLTKTKFKTPKSKGKIFTLLLLSSPEKWLNSLPKLKSLISPLMPLLKLHMEMVTRLFSKPPPFNQQSLMCYRCKPTLSKLWKQIWLSPTMKSWSTLKRI